MEAVAARRIVYRQVYSLLGSFNVELPSSIKFRFYLVDESHGTYFPMMFSPLVVLNDGALRFHTWEASQLVKAS